MLPIGGLILARVPMDYKPLSGREFPRFSAIKTFFRLPVVDLSSDYDVALFGVPFDGGASYRPGARFAPSQVREASSLGRGFHLLGGGIPVFDRIKVADIGDCPVVPIDLQQTYGKIELFVGKILENKKRFIACGGDHSITLPILRALRKYYQKPLNFIHFDAHSDTYPAAWGCEYHHGSFARHAVEEGLVAPTQMLQIGIRGPLSSSDDLTFPQENKMRVITVDEVREMPLRDFLKTIPPFDNGSPTYISFDVDSLDPAYAPGTGTPAIGGLTTYETQKILQSLRIQNLVGSDVVEISPPSDHADLTSLAGVDVMFNILALMAMEFG